MTFLLTPIPRAILLTPTIPHNPSVGITFFPYWRLLPSLRLSSCFLFIRKRIRLKSIRLIAICHFPKCSTQIAIRWVGFGYLTNWVRRIASKSKSTVRNNECLVAGPPYLVRQKIALENEPVLATDHLRTFIYVYTF